MGAVGVIFGGPSPEHDVSVLTGLQAARALWATGRSVRGLYWSKTGEWFEAPPDAEARQFVDGVPRGAPRLELAASANGGFVQPGGRLSRGRAVELDAVLVCCHGGPGEDGTLQGVLDLAGVAYSGPGAACAALGMDKLAFGALSKAAGMPTLPRFLVGGADPPFDPPYIVKPRFGGSSIGIHVAADAQTCSDLLRADPHLRRGAVVEPYRPDLVDANVAVRTWPAVSLSAIERPLRSHAGGEILSYADKYVGGEGMASAPRELPAQLPAEQLDKIREVATSLVDLIGVRGVQRVDFLVGEGDCYLNEINTIPGSLARYLWVDPPLAFDRLLEDLLDEARARPSAAFTTAGADGSALRSAGEIGSKLA